MTSARLILLIRDEAGSTVSEYAFIASLVAVSIIGAALSLGNEVSTKYDTVQTQYEAANHSN